MQENQFYSYRSRINRGGALRQEDEQPRRAPAPQGYARSQPGMLRVSPRPHPIPAPSPGRRFCSEPAKNPPIRAPKFRLGATAGQKLGGFYPRKSRIGLQTPPRAWLRGAHGPGGSPHPDPRRPRHVPAPSWNPFPSPPHEAPSVFYSSRLSAGLWLKSIGFVHDFIVFFGVRETAKQPIPLGGGGLNAARPAQRSRGGRGAWE